MSSSIPISNNLRKDPFCDDKHLQRHWREHSDSVSSVVVATVAVSTANVNTGNGVEQTDCASLYSEKSVVHMAAKETMMLSSGSP